jgi:FkbM family methyltransferase
VTEPLAETGAIVHAFEPDPYAFEKVSRRMRNRDNVHLHNAAVSVQAGTLRLMRAANFDDNPKGGSVKSTLISGGRNINEEDGIDVDVIAFPDLLRDLARDHGEVAFVKMDIEGAELELLEHMLANDLFDLVRLTVAETHENKFADLRPRFAALRESVAAAHPITRVNLDWI